MRKYLLVAVGLSIALTVYGCGGDDEEEKNPLLGGYTQVTSTGADQVACLGAGMDGYSTTTLEVTKTGYTLESVYSPDCSENLTHQMKMTQGYKMSSSASTLEDGNKGYNVDYNGDIKTYYTPLTAEQATEWNTDSKCGKTDWAVDVEADVSDTSCGSDPGYKYDVWGKIDIYLYFGDTGGGYDGTTEENRPIALDTDPGSYWREGTK